MMTFFVMVVHFSPFKSLDSTLHFISIHGFSRVAVPFFVLCAGYFISNDGVINREILIKTVRKLALLYLFWSIVYLPLIFIEFIQLNHSLSLMYFIQRIMFKGTFFHLWYFAAIILSLLLIYNLQRFTSLKTILIVALILYGISALNDGYYYVSADSAFLSLLSNQLESWFFGVRNGLFYTPVFIVIGMLIKKMNKSIRMSLLLKSLGIASALLLTEIFIIKTQSWAIDYNITLMILPFSVLVFLISLEIDYQHNTTQFKEMAATMYYTHILFYAFVELVFFNRTMETFRTDRVRIIV